MTETVAGVEVYCVSLAQDVPYLGPLRENETVNEHGYFVRAGNRTVYPRMNRSIVVRIWTDRETEGWGETYGLIAPQATAAIISDLLSGFVKGRNPLDVEQIYDDLYDLMRVRGNSGGFYHDALAAIDIALWDIAGKLSHQPLSTLLGGRVREIIPAYVSGLPESTLEKRCELAVAWRNRGFDSFKFALPVADQGAAAEMAALRNHLGASARIAADLHWAFTPKGSVTLAKELSPYNPWFLEAPVAPEDIEGLSWVAANTGCDIAVGEEWRTVYDARLRIDRNACQIVQPEMGHTGVTQFMRIARHAEAKQKSIMPHATIGAGIFLAASLQASAALHNVVCHEYQHSIFDSFKHFTIGELNCEAGAYDAPTGHGIGVQPSTEMKAKMDPL